MIEVGSLEEAQRYDKCVLREALAGGRWRLHFSGDVLPSRPEIGDGIRDVGATREIDVTDYSALVRTTLPKSPGNPANHIADSYRTWRPAIQCALDAAAAIHGGATVIIPARQEPYLLDDGITVSSNTRLVCNGTLKLADYTLVGGTVVLAGENITVENIDIDNSSIYAGGSGQNGIGITHGSNIRVIGGRIRNCARGQDFVTPGSPNDGGKGVQVESGQGSGIVVDGVRFENCFIAISSIRDPAVPGPYSGIIFRNITAYNCSILAIVKQVNINSTSGLEHTVQISGFYARNCGSFEGVLQFSRAANVVVKDGVVVNDPAVLSAPLIRGNHRNCEFSDIFFSGNADSIVNLDPSTYAPDQSNPQSGNEYWIKHAGTVAYLANSSLSTTNRVLIGAAGKFSLQNDVSEGFFGYELRNGNSTLQVACGGKCAIVGTNTNWAPYSNIKRFADLPLNYSIPALQAPALKFPAVHFPSADPNALDDYAEGVWTPVDDTGLAALAVAYGDFVKVGAMVFASFRITFPTTSTTAPAKIRGLPVIAKNVSGRVTCGLSIRTTDCGQAVGVAINAGQSAFYISSVDGTLLKNVELSGKTIDGVITYIADS